ncbi:Protein BREAST CANCER SUSCEPTIBILITY 1-like protein [Bienertia sinuspersici]
MADTLYLEKMGRELKCPICLSLLNSAASLTCNHVFCNSCIQKSMRSGSNCPVCKVPYQRREIRPAPHMDNLVNIYKSMEVASGVRLYVTQNEPTTKLTDAEMQANDVLDATTENGGEHQELVMCPRMEQTSSIAPKLKPKRSGRNRGTSSFATNKRVQVPQSPTTETPIRQKKEGLSQNKATTSFINRCSSISCEHPLSTHKERLNLSPFFWLREEVERASQQTDVDQLTLSCTPEKAPSFSDLKDSDDDVPPEISLEEQPHKCNAYVTDSEMFEWTQRECSPELCSSPPKRVEDKDCDKVLGKRMEAASRSAASDSKLITEQLANVSPKEKYSTMDNELHNNVFSKRKREDSLNGCKFPHKRGGKEIKESKSKCRKNNMEVAEVYDSPKTPDDSMPCKGFDAEMVLGSSKAAGTSKTGYFESNDARTMNEVGKHVVPESPVASRSIRDTCRKKKSKIIKRKFNSIEPSNKCQTAKRKKQKKNFARPIVNKEKVYPSNEMFVKRPCKVGKSSSSCKASNKPKEICQLTSVSKQKFCLDDNSGGKIADAGETSAQAAADSVPAKSNNDNSGNSIEKGKVHCNKNMPSWRNYDTVSIKCAFCHSTEETEVTGEMAHYSEGRPVTANHSGGSVIHSHKYCAEAPNVYFEENIAVNLVEELTRSRRIKCSLCGVKGAALGCYEKSCRKSFHVPCAKMLRECRWDTDHFVILCPLHASSKLPCELPQPLVKKRKCNTVRNVPCQRPQVAVRQVTATTSRWNCGRPSEKVVLCCSALSAIEKEAVSELAKSSGAVVSGSWNPSVTHVIASTNENGACKRTLKILMGILEGKWILSIKWVQACKEAMRLVEETPYEITCDIHGVQNGPCLGRLRLLNKQPRLFAGFNFYFTGDFEPSYKGYLQDLVTVAGGTVLHRKPIAQTQGVGAPCSLAPLTVIIYSIELPANCDTSKKDVVLERRHSDAKALAISSGAKLANNFWVLNCIAGHKVQNL